MNKLEELIKKLCPDGVDYKSVSEVTTVLRGKRLTTKELSNKNTIPVFHGGLVPIGYYTKSNRPANTVMIINVGASAGTVEYSNVDFWSSDGCFCLKQTPILNNRFLYHYFKNNEQDLMSKVRRAGIPTLDSNVIERYLIPIPPMDIQNEIVRILDSFINLTKELTAELSERTKQYHYYRDYIINSIKAPSIKLGDFATIVRGGNFQKKDFVETGMPCIHYGQMYTHFGIYTDHVIKNISEEKYNKSKQAEPGDIVMAVTSETVEDVCSCTAWVGSNNIAVSGHTAIIHHNQNAKFLSYFFHSSYFNKQKIKLAHGTKVIEVTPAKLNEILVPLPSLTEQSQIVETLDYFDSLCNDVLKGIPAEIEARQKQYEYYRDKLLTFKRKEA